jgi:A/G-specific adenine glycosylase
MRTKHRISLLEKYQREELVHRDIVCRRLLNLENKKETNEMTSTQDPARILEVERMPTLSHGFTHFSLDIRPLHVRVSALAPQAAEPGVTWLSLEDARSAAIPVPVKKILAQL